MPEPQSCANGTIAFAKIHIILESNSLLAKKIKKSWNYMEEKRKMSIFLKATRAQATPSSSSGRIKVKLHMKWYE